MKNNILKRIAVFILVFSIVMADKISNSLLVVFSMNNRNEEIEEIVENEENDADFDEFYDEIIEEEPKYNHIEESQKTESSSEKRKILDIDEEVEEVFDDEYLGYGEEGSEENKIELSEYRELSVLEQLIYNKKDSAEMNEDVINIVDDIVLYYPIYVRDDVSININDKKITSPVIESAFIVSGSITLYGNDGIIESQNFKYPTFDLLNGKLTVEGGCIKGAYIGGTAVRANDSSVIINGGSIIGGDGEDFYDDVGGDGGCAIVATFSDDNNSIVFNGGNVIGGKGGVGYNGVEESYGGYAFFDGEFLYEDEEFYIRGSRNEIGGGSGGCGIYLTSGKNLNVIINKEGVKGGDGGGANRKVKKEVKYGATLPSQFDLRKYVENGVERSVVTSLHDQFQSGLCNTFSTVASAESYLLRYHPEYVEELGYNPNLTYTKNFPSEQREKVTVGTKEVTLGTTGYYDNEFKLSEAYLAYTLRYHPQDPLGRAKQSKAVPTKPGKRYFNIGSSAMEMINFLAPFRGIPTEKSFSNTIMTDTINGLIITQAEDADDDEIEEGDGITEKTTHVYEEDNSIMISSGDTYSNVLLKSAKYVKYTDCSSKEEFLRGIKEAIYNNCAVVLGGNFVYGGGCSAYERPKDDEHNVYMYMDSQSGGGHAVSVVGWDDNFPVSKFVEAKSKFSYSSEAERNKKPTNNGALIIKQSTYGPMWTYIYYDSIFGNSWHYQVFDWELPDTYYDNMYYYDGGTSATRNQPLGYQLVPGETAPKYISSPCVLFRPTSISEQVIRAVSFVSNDNINVEDDSQKPRLQIFKAEVGSSLKKEGDYIVDIPITLHKGLNFIELPKPIKIESSYTNYVCSINYSNCSNKSYGATIDYCEDDEDPNYTISNDVKFISGFSGNSYLYREHDGSYSKYTHGNFRIKMITSFEKFITFDGNGGNFGEGKNNITLSRLYGDKVLNEEVTKPTYGTREFLGFSTDKDATEPNITSDTLFKSKNNETYYAIYSKVEETTVEETSPTETTPEETSLTETTPEETSPTETTPEETSPTETTPEETSPTETTPEETSPTETTPEETSPTETTPEETSPTETTPEETSPTETTPEETSPTETTPEETSPTETSPTETTPEETSSTKIALEETTKSVETTTGTANTYVRGGSSNTSGGIEGTDIVAPVAPEDQYRVRNNSIGVTKVEKTLNVQISALSDIMVWNYDVNKNNWSLQVVDKSGDAHSVKSTLYVDSSSAIKNKNNLPDVYLLDENGQLAKGFVDYKDGNRYYFEQNDSLNIGKMVRGWKEIESGRWYYFDVNGIMKKNTTTPDGFYVNEEGVYVDKNKSNTTYTEKVNKSNVIVNTNKMQY